MAENIMQSEKDHNTQDITTIETSADNFSSELLARSTDVSSTQSLIIWTPRFIVTFTLILVAGLSLASLLAQGVQSGSFTIGLVHLVYALPLFGCCIILLKQVHSPWIRAGAIFGCIWTILNITNAVLSLLAVDPRANAIIYLNTAMDSALLSMYICIAIAHLPSSRWDLWFFRLTPALSITLVAVSYFLVPPGTRNLSSLEPIISTGLLIVSVLIWWLRSSSWKIKAGPTFLFGVAPFIQLLLNIPNFPTLEMEAFFSQVILLSILLGVIRVWQEEKQRQH